MKLLETIYRSNVQKRLKIDLNSKIIARCITMGHKCKLGRINKATTVVSAETRRLLPQTFITMSHIVHPHAQMQPINNISQYAEIVSKIFSRFLIAHPKLSMGNVDSTVCALLTLGSTGFVCNGMTIVEKIPWLLSSMPLPNEMSNVPKINCRSMSTGIRAFKSYVFNQNGRPTYNKCVLDFVLLFARGRAPGK